MDGTRKREGKNILIRARLTDEEWTAIRHEAIDRHMLISDYMAAVIRAGRECIPPIDKKEEVA